MRDEVDIVELDEKYYLFWMKFDPDPRRRPVFCVFLENTVNLGRKVRNRRLVRSDDLFFSEITLFLGEKVHYLERFEVMTFVFCLKIAAFLGRKVHYLE